MGPGAYDAGRADSLTKTKTTTINMASSPARPSTFARVGGSEVAPGQYDDGKTFGSETKSFTIGVKRAAKATESIGPGAYSPERADEITKSKITTINMGSSPARGSFIKKDDANIGPGQYDDRNYEIASKTKSFTIGEKRQTRIVESMGPGAYSPERADTITKTKTTTVNMGSSPARGSFIKQGDANVGPG